MEETTEQLVARARSGDRHALDALLREMRDPVYNLATRMLGSASDAEDAAQEILIRLITGLDSFRGESKFRTWVYRVASNHLLTARKRAAEQRTESFEALAEYLEHGMSANMPPVDNSLLAREAMLACTQNMLLALDRDHRLAFILGEILELPSEEAASVLAISDDAFRKRLSRARTRMDEFTAATCGIVDPNKPCRCGSQAANALAKGTIDPSRLTWAVHRTRATDNKPTHVEEIAGLVRSVELLRRTPTYAAPESLVDNLRDLLLGRSEGSILS